ncbi:MAG: FKBP-type peptidyl-prolyl cis-trans isomerase [Bacteroidetes bacterium]|jgi:FKBP-type peptidyl-prolyl cis-trans isomerase|nr:FKBP-type peptidyl-prolyl cis-trans isomerase [Bacteroidota bacterium]
MLSGRFRFLWVVIFFIACSSNENTKQTPVPDSKNLKEQMVRVNKVQTYNEDSQIDDFLKRYQYPVNTTATGLRYYIYKKTEGEQPGAHSIVKINYNVKLLDGTVCYSSDSLGALEFQIGKTDLPVGLQEGMQLMKTGEQAIFISPSKLGYGLTGDGAEIPPNAVLFYDVKLLRVIKK